ncbi:MAG: FAD:protein FMN transferase [Rikenellaceae bacterium]
MAKCTLNTILTFVAALILLSCSTPQKEYQQIKNVPMLGTTLNIIADIHADSLTALLDAAMEIDRDMKAQMSIFDSTSLVSQINRSQSDSLTSEMIRNIQLADSISRLSGGAYDITVMPLVEAWGFARKEALKDPNIDSLLEFVGYQKISISPEGRLVKEDPRMKLDFNSIAKGYTVDKLAQRVAQMGAKNFLVDIGGEINSRGINSRGVGWTIGVESPIDGNMTDGDYLQKAITIDPQSSMRAMATSGNYRRFYLSDKGEKIAHTIDPRTGRSHTSKLLSATVIASSCALADGLATMFLAVGSDSAVELSKTIEGVEVYFIFAGEDGAEYEEYMSEGMTQMINK